MQLGIITDNRKWDESEFIEAKKRGLKFLEYCVNIDIDALRFAARKEEFKGYVDKHGVGVGSVGRWGSDRINPDGTINEEEYKITEALIDFCEYVGCKVFVMGCNAPEGRTLYDNIVSAVNLFRKVVDYGEKHNVKIAVYNCDWNNFIYEEKMWDIILPAVPGLGIKFDASHAIHRKSDWEKQMRDYGNKFYHVHLKGVQYINGQLYDNPPAGLDQMNWGSYFNLIYLLKYDRTMSIEPHSAFWQGEIGEKGIDYSVEYLRKFLL